MTTLSIAQPESVRRYTVIGKAVTGVLLDHSPNDMTIRIHDKLVHSTDYDRLLQQLKSSEAREAREVALRTMLRVALTDCANRLQRCIVHSGSDKESTALAVEGYRDVVRDAAITEGASK